MDIEPTVRQFQRIILDIEVQQICEYVGFESDEIAQFLETRLIEQTDPRPKCRVMIIAGSRRQGVWYFFLERVTCLGKFLVELIRIFMDGEMQGQREKSLNRSFLGLIQSLCSFQLTAITTDPAACKVLSEMLDPVEPAIPTPTYCDKDSDQIRP